MASRLGEVDQLPFDFHTRSTSTSLHFYMESRKRTQWLYVIYQCHQCLRCFYHPNCDQPTHHLTCGPLVCGIVEGTAKEELCIKCFNANQAINTQVQKDDLEKEQHQQQQQQQPSV